MANVQFNVAKGSVVEKVRDGATLKALLLTAAEADADIVDHDDVAALLGAAGNTEATFTNYARQTLTGVAASVNDGTDTAKADADDIVWASAGGASNETLVALVVYEDVDATDANAIPLLKYDFSVTTDGQNLTAAVHVDGLLEAS